MTNRKSKRKIGIVGFGEIGEYIYNGLTDSEEFEICFIWNRNKEKLVNLPKDIILTNLDDFKLRSADLIIEVAHISITKQYGEQFLDHGDFMIGSPTALADAELEGRLRKRALESGNGLYVPAGAFWGGEDIKKMADQNSLKALKVTMKKHPSSFKLLGEIAEKNKKVGDEPVILYQGPVRQLCPMAPANVNTMACAAIAGYNLGFDGVEGCLVADKSLNCHIVEIDVTGPASGDDGQHFTVRTVRTNPSKVGAVTGNATYASFLQSVKRAHGKGGGVHLC